MQWWNFHFQIYFFILQNTIIETGSALVVQHSLGISFEARKIKSEYQRTFRVGSWR
jgi:hypothetical protein